MTGNEQRARVVDKALIFVRGVTLRRAEGLVAAGGLTRDQLDDVIDAWNEFFVGTDERDEALFEMCIRDAIEAAAAGREWRPSVGEDRTAATDPGEVDAAMQHARNRGLSDTDAREVIDIWVSWYETAPYPFSWMWIRDAMNRRAKGMDWRPKA